MGLLLGAKAHEPLDPGTVIPTAAEDDDLARRREMAHVTPSIHLGHFPLRWGGQRHHPEDPRTHPLGDRLDGIVLTGPGPIPTLKDDAHLQNLLYHPLQTRHAASMRAAPGANGHRRGGGLSEPARRGRGGGWSGGGVLR